MTACVTTNFLDPHSIYPVIDPRRTAGPGPFVYAYPFAWDEVQIGVTRFDPAAACQMVVNFSSTLQESKEIQGWNLFNNAWVDRIGSAGLGLPTSMTLTKARGAGQSCGTGVDTVILCRYFAWPRGRTALYTFDPQDFWDFWGGAALPSIG